MKKTRLKVLVLAGLVHLALAGGVGALEVYRIGGADQPRPEGSGINFHQLQWGDFEEREGLEEDALAAGVVRPFFLNPDDDIARTSVIRGGGPYVVVNAQSYSVTDASKTMVDGDPETFYEWVATTQPLHKSVSLRQRRITLDLGGLFQVNRVRLFTSQSGHYPDKLDIATSTEFINDSNSLSLRGQLASRVLENVQDTLDVRFPPAVARSVGLLLYRISSKAVTVAEVEIYGEGYVNQASYAGPFIDLGEPAIWGDIRWQGQQDPQAKVWIQSRAGRDPDPNVYWRFTGRGDEVTKFDERGRLLDSRAYAQLKPGEAAEITYDLENWSFWSPPYDFADSSGTLVRSPAPNSVFQLRVDFFSTVRDGGALEFVEFSATKPPLVEEVVGEIYPPEVPLGEVAQLTYAIAPTIRAQHVGFDRIEIAAPFGLVGVDSVRIGRVPVDFTLQIERPDSTLFSVQLPRHLEAKDSGELVEVVFRAPVLRYGTAFDGWVRDTAQPLELAQRVNPGDASAELPSEGLIVRTSLSDRLLGDLQVEPRTLTPNGDGLNETVEFSFNLLQLTDEVPLRLEIFDLSGRQWRSIAETLPQSGRFHFSWDGRDGDGGVVPPGLYVYRLAVEAERGDAQQSGTIAVVY